MIAPIRLRKFPKTDTSVGTNNPLLKNPGSGPKPFVQIKNGAVVLAFTSLPLWQGQDVSRN